MDEIKENSFSEDDNSNKKQRIFFDRKLCKKVAREQLKSRMVIPVISTVIFIGVLFVLQKSPLIPQDYKELMNRIMAKEQVTIMFTELIGIIRKMSLYFAISFILSSTFKGAYIQFYQKMFRTKENLFFSDFVDGFSICIKAVFIQFYVYIPVLTGFLVFFLASIQSKPGISLLGFFMMLFGCIRYYARKMAMYVIAEYPKMGVFKACGLSRIMTGGYKFDLFLFDLSFFPWALFSELSFYAGYLWYLPYKNMSMVNAYYLLKKNALDLGLVKDSDFQTEFLQLTV